jgi:hypothetical protein
MWTALDRKRALRPFLDRLYRPAASVLVPAEDDVIACRCEASRSVGSAERRGSGLTGPNQLKAFTRGGMGPCRGCICEPVVAAVIAETLGKPTAQIGTYRPRAPYKPITIGAVTDLDAGDGE